MALGDELTAPERARRFARYFRPLVVRQRVLLKDLAEACDVSPSTVANWSAGNTLPTVESMAKMAQALNAPRVLSFGIQLRTKTCKHCGVEFVDRTRHHNRLFCTDSHNRRYQQSKADESVLARSKELHSDNRKMREAVAMYCRAKNVDYCHDAECPLREWSPLPLVPDLDVRPPERKASDKMMAFLERNRPAL